MTEVPAATIILASASQSRAAILRQTGLEFAIYPADVDEEAIKIDMLAQKADHAHIAKALAEVKALALSKQHPGALVIGADQILSADGFLYSKPENLAGARAQLEALSGRTHQLISAVTVALRGEIQWGHVDSASLKMHSLSARFIDDYLARMGDAALSTLGCYQLEGLGPLLFEEIRGDYYAILGLPLLPLLGFLRDRKAIAS